MKGKNKMSRIQIISLGFIIIILTGVLLLKLPFATKSGEAADWMTAIFTATSATCDGACCGRYIYILVTIRTGCYSVSDTDRRTGIYVYRHFSSSFLQKTYRSQRTGADAGERQCAAD